MNKWILGARPRTLPAAIAPVLVGTALIRRDHTPINWTNALLALVVSLLLQIAVNYSNDYSDGIRGTDADRVGPIRLVASGLASAKAVKNAALIAFLIASIAGLVLALRTSPWLILVGVIAIIAAWGYTGGSKPYGYYGLGELSVFLFFGLVATMGSYYAQAEQLTRRSLLISIPMGCIACALLAVNNLRDLPKDKLVGKKTLAVRLGDDQARDFLIGLLIVAQISGLLVCTFDGWGILTIIPGFIAARIIGLIRSGIMGKELIPVLGLLGKYQLFFALTLSVALFF
jgi:1,4-dihydroxy-2-naphthoate octaprenyltransferase